MHLEEQAPEASQHLKTHLDRGHAYVSFESEEVLDLLNRHIILPRKLSRFHLFVREQLLLRSPEYRGSIAAITTHFKRRSTYPPVEFVFDALRFIHQEAENMSAKDEQIIREVAADLIRATDEQAEFRSRRGFYHRPHEKLPFTTEYFQKEYKNLL